MRSVTWQSRTLFAGCAGLALGLASTTALAQTTGAEAEQIASALKRFIDDQILEPNPEIALDFNGSIEVRAAGDHYAGTIPAGRMMIDVDHGDTAIFDFAEPLTFEIRVTERGWYDTSFVVPSSVRISSEQDPTAAVTLSLGGQTGALTIAPEFETAVDADIVWSDIAMQVADTPGELTIAEVALLQQTEEVTAGIFDTDFSFDLSELYISVPEEDVLIELDSAGIFGAATGIDYAAWLPFNQAIKDLMPRLEESPEDPALFEEMRTLLAETPALLADIQATYFLEGLRIDTPDAYVAIDGAAAGVAMTGLDTDRATIGISLSVAELGIQPQLPFERLLPIDTGYDIRIVDVPTEVLLAWLDGVLATIPSLGPDDAIEASLMPLYGQVADSGAFLDIADIHYDAAAGALAVAGEVTPDTSALFGVTAAVELDVTNMARFIEAMRALPDFGSEAAAGFAVIQAFGAQEVNDQGEPVHVYQFEVTQQGGMTLNGNDLGPIIEQLR